MQHGPMNQIRRLLVANRSEIAIRVLRAANELGMTTIAIYSEEDRFALHRFKADESYLVGKGLAPIAAYLSIDDVLRIAREARADAVHPGYGFLSENPDFAQACIDAGLIFVGPSPDTMRLLGNKVAARNAAVDAGVPVMPATPPLPRDEDKAVASAEEIGFPVMLKASWGGGGRGMRVIPDADTLRDQLQPARREADSAFGNDEVYLEKLVERAAHVEVQLLGDHHGNLVHLYERDCTVQRRNQKVVERAPAPYLSDEQRQELCGAALRLGEAAGYYGAGTVEFLMDRDTSRFYFIEVNPRVQVEHTVTEEVTGIDIVKAQLCIAQGARIGDKNSGVRRQANIRVNGHALQCRVTTEDPENKFIPDYGRIRAYRGATGFGVRLDGGTAYSGAVITPFYDSLLEKVTAWAPTEEEAIRRMDRALREFRIRGVSTNLAFLENVINHPQFADASYTTRFIDTTPELFRFPRRRDRATRLLRYIAEVIVNGHPQVEGRRSPSILIDAPVPELSPEPPPPGSRQRLQELGAQGFAQWMLDQTPVLLTDTTMRDAHQSLLATRVRTHDLLRIAPTYAARLPNLLSLECWGGATFDVAMRFLHEDPWERLAELREAVPNLLLQMLLRASNAVGYKNYPDNVVRRFVELSAETGLDLFRVFDALNWVDNMRVAIDAVRESDMLCEAAICYSGDLTDPNEAKYTLGYYVEMAQQLEKAGAQVLGIKDMAGVCKPAAIRKLVPALRDAVGMPLHFHTHDTSGIAAATVLAAVDAGVDAVDGAMDTMSGLTSQPNLGSIVHALAGETRDPGVDRKAMREVSRYWELVREYYAPFESEIRSGTSDLYRHAMPGGQYTNLREQARSLGIEERWPEVSKTYSEVNDMFGNIVKVTPTSKVVGDMALFMVTSGLSRDDVEDPDKEIAFPDSVIQFFGGELGQPMGGFPRALQKKVLGSREPMTERPGATLPPVNFDAERAKAEKAVGRKVSDTELCSYVLYPKVFTDFAHVRRRYGPVDKVPTPVFFYGVEEGREIGVEIDRGKTLIVRLLAVGEPSEDGRRRVFFELNGQPRAVSVDDKSAAQTRPAARKADDGNDAHVPAPMPGLIVKVSVQPGQEVKRGEPMLAIEAMKMETSVTAERDARVAEVLVSVGQRVDTKDLLVVLEKST